MKLSVIGTGYVGLVTGTCFAQMGNTVTCIDIDQIKVNKMISGKCPIYEPGLEGLMVESFNNKRLSFTTDYKTATDSSVVFLAVGTPSRKDGSAELKFIYEALDELIKVLKEGAIIVLKSTVPIGTGESVKHYLSEKSAKRFTVVNNPEFLKEGSAVNDFMKPERVIIGTDNDAAWGILKELYRPFNKQSSRTIRMSNLSAEMTKYAANCFLATKISFMNEIAKLCDYTGANVTEVREGISSDSRIGAQFLYPGPGYGGSCFPKDVKALAYTAKKFGMNFELVEATESVNTKQKKYMYEKIKKHFKELKGKTIAIWGVAFKANTDDIRETAAIDIITELDREGANIVFYDPVAGDNFEQFATEKKLNAKKVNNMYEATQSADALCILTEWKQFRSPDFDVLQTQLNEKVIFDGRNLYDENYLSNFGFTYYGVGRGK